MSSGISRYFREDADGCDYGHAIYILAERQLNGQLASEVECFSKEAVENIMNREGPSATRELANREEALIPLNDEAVLAEELDARQRQQRRVARLRLLWSARRLLLKCLACGMAVGLLIALLIPARYESTTRLMPPDNQQGGGIAGMLSAFTGGGGGGGATALEGLAGNVLGVKTSGDLFIGVLQSRTVRDDLITKFNLRKLYWDRRWEDARDDLAKHTDISEDKKSGIIAIKVTDKSPQRAAAMARRVCRRTQRGGDPAEYLGGPPRTIVSRG